MKTSRFNFLWISIAIYLFDIEFAIAQPDTKVVGGIVSAVPFNSSEKPDFIPNLFQELDPEDTGMAGFTNDFRSPRIWGLHWRTYLFGAIGTGVALGDVDGDGLPDLFVVSKNERSRLYRNLGNFRFEDITEWSGIDETLSSVVDKAETPGGGAAFADVNDDGNLDLYLCFLGASNQLWINDGRGRFEERAAEWGVNVRSASVMGYFADYDNDGLLDLYLATNLLQQGDEYPGPKPDHLFRNAGDRFVETTVEAGISGVGHAHSAVWWDFNGDGRMDIYVANDFAGVDKLYKNMGDGSFDDVIAEASPRAPYYGMGSDFGDVNGDGLEDFWVADMAPSSRARYKRTLESHEHVYEGLEGSLPNQYMQNVFLLNLGGERFTDVAALAGLHRTDWTWASRLVDLDNDGWLDAYVTNGMLRNFNDGDLGMRLRGQNNLQHYAQIFKPTPVLNEENLAYRNAGGILFENAGPLWGLDKTGVSFGAAFGDLNRDGRLDLVLSNLREPPSIYRGWESKNSRVFIELRGRESNHFGLGARVEILVDGLRQVKTLMPHRGYMSSDEPVLHFGLGEAEQIDQMLIGWPSGRVQRLHGLPVNHRFIIEERGDHSSLTPQSTPYFERVAGRFPNSVSRQDPGARELSVQPLLPFARSRLLGAAAAGDLNDDGRDDLILGGPSGQEASVVLGGREFAFEQAWSLDLEEDFPSADADFALRDFNGDGALDLMVVSGGASLDQDDPGYQDRMYFGDGSGEFLRDFESPLSASISSTEAVAVGDFDMDGVNDLFVGGGSIPGRYPESVHSTLWRGRPGGGFERVGEDAAPGLFQVGRVTAADWVNFRGESYPDLVILQEWGPPQLWRNREGRLVLEKGALDGSDLSGLWTSMATGDFDGDGQLDLAVGNLGLNTGGLWDPAKGPRRLWWRSEDRRVDLIETHYENGEEWALVWWDRLKESILGRVARARNYTEFAQKTAFELFGDLRANGYAPLDLTETRSGVFWQNKSGTFLFEALPPFGQSGRVISLLAEDIDRDGLNDLVASIELPSLAPWTARKEQGHMALFLGKANRQWKVALPHSSGLHVGAASPRDLLWADMDGDTSKELVVVLAEGEPLVFKRRD